MFYMVSITIEHFRVVPSASSTGFSSLGLVTLTPGKKFYGTIMTHRILGNPGLQRGWEGIGKGETGCGKKKERGGDGKGKRKGEALGSFSIQIISRSKSKHH